MIDGISSSFGITGGMQSAGMRPDFQTMFNRVDDNEDGGISKDELQHMTDELSEKTGLTFDIDDLFAQFDADGNAVLNSDEAKSAMDSMSDAVDGRMLGGMMMGRMGVMKPDFQQIFDRLNEDDDDGISKAELQTLTDKLSEKTGLTFTIDDLFAQFNADEDGTLNLQEAESAMDSIIEEMENQRLANMENLRDLNLYPLQKIALYQQNATDSSGSAVQSFLNTVSADDKASDTSFQGGLSPLGLNKIGNFSPISLFA